MAHANWGGPGAGYSGDPQEFTRTAPEMETHQDPAWHGQPPVTRQAPAQMQGHPPLPEEMDPYAAVRPTPQAAGYGAPVRPTSQAPQRPMTPPGPQSHAPQAAFAERAPMRPMAAAHNAGPQAEPALTTAPVSAPSGGQSTARAPQQDHYYAAPPGPAPEARREKGGGIVALAGAASSVALIVGLAVWGINLAVRDVTDVPVVAALEGPMRVQPDTPGGTSADHQGLAVNNVAADGSAEGPADHLVLAPSAAQLDDSDVPTAATPEILAAADNRGTLGTAPLDVAMSGADAELLVDDLVEQIIGDAAPLSEDTAARVGAADSGAVLIPASVPGVSLSPRPRPRPGSLVTRTASNPATDPLLVDPSASATQSGAPEVDPTSIPVGTRLVQLGAYDSINVARAEWEQLATRFPDNMEGKSRVIEQAQSGGKVFYRLRAMGFADLTDARRFCSALMSGQAACIPVVTR